MTVDAVRAGPRASRRSSSTSSTAPPAARCGGFLHRGRQLRDFVRVYCTRAVRGARDPRDRPGHDRARPASSSTTRAGSPAAPTASSTQHFPQPGWVEHDAAEIWEVTRRGRRARRSPTPGIDGRRAARRSASPTSARPSCAWDPATGEPLHRALVWQDRRTAGALRRAARGRATSRWSASAPASCSTPTSPAPRSSGCSSNVDGLPSARDGARLRHDRLLARSSSSPAAHVTDYSNASRTLLFDIRSAAPGTPSSASCSACRPARLPEPLPSAARLRRRPTGASAATVPVAGIAGDQQAALFGQACLEPGMAKNTYGTGSFVLLNTGDRGAARPATGLLTTVAWGIGERDRLRARGRVFVTGAAVQWLRDGLGIIDDGGRDRGARRARSTPTTASTSCPRSPASARRTGTPTRAARSSGSPAAAAARTSRARRSRRSPTRPSTRSRAHGGGVGRARSPSCRPTAARPPTRWLMQFQADVLGVPGGRARGRRDDRARRRLPRRGRRPALWTLRAGARRCGARRARYEPRMGEDERDALLGRWQRARRALARLGAAT